MEAVLQSTSPVTKNVLIRAGAGAGKTTRLINEVYNFFHSHKKQADTWPRVVLTTFSNKATQEINERLLKKAIETYDREFFEFINSKGHLLVSTIHGVLHMFIGQNQSEFGLTKDFAVVNDSEIARRQQKLFRKIVNEEPVVAVMLDTFTLSELYTLVCDYRQFRLTVGSLKAIDRAAFASYLQKLKSEFISEFRVHLNVLRRSKLTDAWANALQNFPNIDSEDAETIAALLAWEETLARLPTVSKKGDEDLILSQAGFVSSIKKLREFRDRNYHEDFLENFQLIQTTFEDVAEKFFAAVNADQKESQQISISDIETLCFQIIETKPYLFETFSKKWDFWMIDEFQDTSPIQISLLNKLIGKARVFFVGDPQQSIYYFRGSDSRVFDGKMNELKSSGHIEVLDNNYRSHSGVLNFINEFFSRQYRQFQKMVPIKENVNLKQDVNVYEIGDKTENAALTAKQISRLVKQHPEIKLEDVVVLSRTNRDLDDLAVQLEVLGVPHYVHSQGQFFKQREILDILFFVRFLVRPGDINNLVFLLKTPAMGLTPDEIKIVTQDYRSWEQLVFHKDGQPSRVAHAIDALNRYLLKSIDIGLLETTQLFAVNEASFVLNHIADSSGKKESNIWKCFFWLREELAKGLDSFLVQLDAVLDPNKNDFYEESETQAIVEPKKIQMMTIHASKGLQFDHVVVIGIHSPQRTRGRYTLDVDPETKEYSIFIKNKAKDDKIRSPIHWQQWAIQKEREAEEFERLLYVALTRARKMVSLFTLNKFSESTWAHQVRDFYNQYLMNKDSLVFSMGWNTIDANSFVDDTILQVPSAGLHVETASVDTSPFSFFSQLDLKISEGEVRGPLSFSSSKGKRQSSLNQVIISQKGIETHHRREKGMFEFSYYPQFSYGVDLVKIFATGLREYRFTFQYGEYQIVGSIDFVYFGSDRVLIIDYKSGRSTHTELYSEQLKFYAQCLAYIKKLPATTVFDLAIDYVDQKKVDHLLYQLQPMGFYFDKFIQDRESENIVG
jgi:ATP-dependent helicase/nuclease subunit A